MCGVQCQLSAAERVHSFDDVVCRLSAHVPPTPTGRATSLVRSGLPDGFRSPRFQYCTDIIHDS